MTGETLNLLEKVEKFINDFDPTNIGSVIVLAILVCVLFIPLTRAIYTASVEEIFMDERRKGRNSFFKLLALLVLFIPSNFALSTQGALIVVELSLGIIGIIVYGVYYAKEAGTREYIKSIEKLNAYYKEKRSDSFLFSIICIMSGLCILMKQMVDNMSLFSCAVVVSTIEVLIICISMPELVNGNVNSYFLDDDKRWFIYKRIDNDTIICGDSMERSKADKYITITFEKLKRKEILHMQNKSLSGTEKGELRNKYKEMRNSKKGKSKKLQTQNKQV